MSRYSQTNVRIPDCAWDALEAIKGERGLSRDETARQLLAEHVAQQVAREPEERLTHISTLVRHPQQRLKSDPPVGRMLRLRLPPELAEQARAVSYRLPGQPIRRGHRDYQARPLTDAVVTAIAVAAREPLTDEVLEGLLPLLRHQAATGLWRLAVAATAQRSEQEVYKAVEPPPSAARGRGEVWIGHGEQRRVHYVADALRDDVAWHGSWRRLVLEWLARRLLVGDRAAANEQMLFEQRAEWGLLQHDLENSSDDDHWLLRGLYGEWEFNDLEGRSGTAVWRAERKVDLQEFECWVMGKPGKLDDAPAQNHVPPARRVMRPQGWVVDNLGGWRSIVWDRNPGPVHESWATHVADGRVVQFSVQDRQVLWPVIQEPGTDEMRPVDGIEVVLAAASRRARGRALPPLALIESILLRLDGHYEDDPVDDVPIDEHLALDAEEWWELLGEVRVPVYTAYRFGLIDTTTRDDVVAQGRAELGAAMRAVIAEAPDARARQALRGAATSPTEFRRIARSLGVEFTAPPVTWVWPVRSLADEVIRGTRPDALEWLSNWVFRHFALGLERSMRNAWHRAFQRFQPPGHGYVTSTVINGALLRSRLESASNFVD